VTDERTRMAGTAVRGKPGVAYRMLGSPSEADDAVQEAWLSRSDTSGVENLGGWLTTVVARVCLDMLRSRRSGREEPPGARVPEPIVSRGDGIDPEREALLADSVGPAVRRPWPGGPQRACPGRTTGARGRRRGSHRGSAWTAPYGTRLHDQWREDRRDRRDRRPRAPPPARPGPPRRLTPKRLHHSSRRTPVAPTHIRRKPRCAMHGRTSADGKRASSYGFRLGARSNSRTLSA
jgi:Sigma-70 region 2